MTAYHLHIEDINPFSPRFDIKGWLSENPLLNPSYKGTLKQGQKETEDNISRKDWLQTEAILDSWLTCNFNTAANYNRLKSVHMTKWKKVPNATVLEKERTKGYYYR